MRRSEEGRIGARFSESDVFLASKAAKIRCGTEREGPLPPIPRVSLLAPAAAPLSTSYILMHILYSMMAMGSERAALAGKMGTAFISCS